jgi:hypothetical protein
MDKTEGELNEAAEGSTSAEVAPATDEKQKA